MGVTDSFPSNVIGELKTSFEEHMGTVDSLGNTHAILGRPLRHNDPNFSIGIFALEVAPEPRSAQIGQEEPTLMTYNYRIQNLVKSASEEEGRLYFSHYAKVVRVVLYRDPSLGVRLRALTEELLDTKEVVQRYGILRQRYQNNDLSGRWAYLATTDFWVQTEVIQL